MDVLHLAIHWVVVPAVLSLMLVIGGAIAGRQRDGDVRRAARAGFWAGLVLAAMFIQWLPARSQAGLLEPVPREPQTILIGTVAGVLAGVVVWLMYSEFRDSRAVGLLAGMLSGTAGLSLAGYIVIPASRAFLAPLSLALAVTLLISTAAVTSLVDRPLLRKP